MQMCALLPYDAHQVAAIPTDTPYDSVFCDVVLRFLLNRSTQIATNIAAVSGAELATTASCK